MDPFLTVYRKNYTKRTTRRPDPKGATSEFKDPIIEGFKNYLRLSNDERPRPQLPIEDADAYLQNFKKKEPKLAKIYYDTPINDGIIAKTFIYNGRTIYQVDYCDLKKDQAYKEEIRRRNMYNLPDDWDIPLTTQKYCYRNPLFINPRATEPVGQSRVPNNLDFNPRIREILKTTTGKSEYNGVIGELGDLIIDQKLHGKVIHPGSGCLNAVGRD